MTRPLLILGGLSALACASQPRVPHPQGKPRHRRRRPGTVVTPSVLFKDIEVKKDTEKHPRPPLYPHPAFAEK